VELREVIKTCSNTKVAEAALVSVGGNLAAVVASEAARRDVSVGGFVAQLVHDFERNDGTCVWARAEQAMRGAEQPILAGLYVIVAYGLLAQNLRLALNVSRVGSGKAHRESERMVA
jgi:hypothetical protein